MNLHIVEYNKNQHFKLWNEFVLNQSVNGTIFHTQLFLSYHKENTFEDKSLLIYSNQELIAVLAVCKTENTYFSHKGTSGGGPVIHKEYFNVLFLDEITKKINTHFNFKIEYFLPEDVFSISSIETLLNTISENKTIEKSKSAYFNLTQNSKIENKRLQTGIRATLNSNIQFNIYHSEEDYIAFYNIIVSNLDKYNSKPIHSLNEFINLKNILNEYQFLFLAKKENEIIGGVWVVKATSFAWHTQYIAKKYAENEQYVMPTLLLKLKEIASFENQNVLSLGSCDGGYESIFSPSLCDFKMKLGAQICYRYKILLK